MLWTDKGAYHKKRDDKNMKKYFQFTKFKQNFILLLILMIFTVIVQCYGGGKWSVREMIIGDSIMIFMFVLGTLIVDWFPIKHKDNDSVVGIKKYFQFTHLKEQIHMGILFITIAAVGRWHDNCSIEYMIKSSFILVIAFVVGSLIADWIQIKNDKLEEQNEGI